MDFLRHQLYRMRDRRSQTFLLLLLFFLYFSNYQYRVADRKESWSDIYKLKKAPEIHLDEPGEDEPHLWKSGDAAQACPIPQLQPFSEAVLEHLKKPTKSFHSCQVEYPLLFNSSLEGELVPTKSLEEFEKLGIHSCSYSVFVREGDDDYSMSNESYPISLTKPTKIPPLHEFLSIKCKNHNNKSHHVEAKSNASFPLKAGKEKTVDMHAFIHLKPEVEKRQDAVEASFMNRTGKGKKRVNVVVFGMDGLSRMNFLRTMPKSYQYFMKTLKGVDMDGYNKVADNTFPNIMPMLANLTASEVDSTCGRKEIYDSCPFIFKNYSAQGYRTSYAEDAADISLFNYERRGFTTPPTDYYMRAYSLAAEQISSQKQVCMGLCYGPRLGFQVMLENVRKFVFEMSRTQKPFFQFTWATSLSHDYLKVVEMGDEPLLRTLEWLHSSGHMNETVFIFMSDHGQRVDSVFRNTLQGQLEDRLPFTIILIPEWMRKGKYSKAYEHLLGNKHRLVTTFDLHETLADLLDLEQVENNRIEKRALALTQLDEKNSTYLPRGISLFLPISKRRTCAMAGIEQNWCTCNLLTRLKPNGTKVQAAALLAVSKLNSVLKPHKKNCSSLKLTRIIMAQHAGKKGSSYEGYLVNFETQPGSGKFEALVGKNGKGKWQVIGTVSRTNLYGNQSHCVHNVVIKLYCYCLDLVEAHPKNE